ncbi:hypothetical protein PBI_HILLTOPFARM_80 [Mycobacterium phage Hilltopfarm]|nr:hypothetical protein PBI_HILLTOPFARM_80 [Mycobacterium phage Hilltopfarm]
MAKDSRLYGKFTLDFPRHPKIAILSDAAFRCLVEATLYSRDQLSDGLLARRYAIATWGLDVLTELCNNDDENPSLIEVEKGWLIHDYAEHQDTKADVEARRERNKAAGQKGGLAKAKRTAKRPAKRPASKTLSENVAETETETETHKEPASAGSTRARTRRPSMSITELATGRPETPPPPAPAEIQRGVPATNAAQLVGEVLPKGRYQPATLTEVRLRVGELLAEGNDEAVIRKAVELWDARDSGGPGLIRSLMAEAAKRLNPNTHNVAAPTKRNRYDEKTAAHAELFTKLMAEAEGPQPNTQHQELTQ